MAVAWEWAAPAATAVVGAVSITGTLLAAKVAASANRDAATENAKASREVALRNAEAQVSLARDARRMNALNDALVHIARVNGVVHSIANGRGAPSDLAGWIESQHHVHAGLTQWGNIPVIEAFNMWSNAFGALSGTGSIRDAARDGEAGLRQLEVQFNQRVREYIDTSDDVGPPGAPLP